MSVDARIARGGALAAWALFFVVLWGTGATGRYLGSRTQWVVPFGAVVLTLAVLAYAYGYLRARRSASVLTLREAVSLFALLLPLAAVVLAPHAALGSFAASRKGGGAFFLSMRPAPPASPADVSFLDIREAEGGEDFADEAGIHSGLRVRLLGFVTGSKYVPAGTFELARFYIACCVADALPVGVPIDGSALHRGRFRRDSWLQVTGSLEHRGKRLVVVADRIVHVSEPSHPYLSFRT
ncbi:MAG TPA: TIGR03943 family protein [Gaiellaceae bacterium]|nr:TIGR03943 family protein [Gaiellaceae bacterium]